MGTNGQPKTRGMAHYLHKQWVSTKSGREDHAKAVEAEKQERIKTGLKAKR
jgi:hypothetical protein